MEEEEQEEGRVFLISWRPDSVPVLVLPGHQRTLALVKPDGVAAGHAETIKTILRSSGFRISQEKALQLDVAMAEAFYSEHAGKPFFRPLIESMTSGPIVALVLECEDAVAKWRYLMGPTDPEKARKEQPQSIRALFGSSTTKNCVHGSDSPESVAREIATIFKDSTAEGHDEL